jgi:pyruvate,water dikinase
MIDAVRRQSDDRSPYVAATRAAAAREALLGRLTELTAGDPETQGTLLAGLHSAGVFMRGRELGKNACIRCINEAKLAMFEVGARMAARGAIDDVQQVFMLLDGELDSFLADPAAWRATILERDAQFAVLATLEPPYIVKQQDGVPPIDQWPVRGRKDVPVAAAGDVLQGAAGAPGAFTGRARIVLHPDQIDDLDAGDVMVAPTTDPSWTPLFLSVGAVVCNVGAVNSHAAIVCRELGVPCAVSVLDATDRIPEGATITVDGSSGTVAVVAVP